MTAAMRSVLVVLLRSWRTFPRGDVGRELRCFDSRTVAALARRGLVEPAPLPATGREPATTYLLLTAAGEAEASRLESATL